MASPSQLFLHHAECRLSLTGHRNAQINTLDSSVGFRYIKACETHLCKCYRSASKSAVLLAPSLFLSRLCTDRNHQLFSRILILKPTVCRLLTARFNCSLLFTSSSFASHQHRLHEKARVLILGFWVRHSLLHTTSQEHAKFFLNTSTACIFQEFILQKHYFSRLTFFCGALFF